MSLITKEVEITLASQTIKYYEDLGYFIPREGFSKGKATVKKGTKILVNISDVPLNSHVLVEYECDYCNTILPITYGDYNRRNHNGKMYCKHCVGKVLRSGENNPHYNFNKTNEERIRGRNYPEYTDFVKRVLARDNYTCQKCGQEHGDIMVHHLDGYDWCIEKRTDVTNGITLCRKCHENFHYLYGKGKNTKSQYEEWIQKPLLLNDYTQEVVIARQVYCLEDCKLFDSAYRCAKEYGFSPRSIYNACNNKTFTKVYKHFIWYDEYITLSCEEIQKIINNDNGLMKKIICVETGEIFPSIKDAEVKCNITHWMMNKSLQTKQQVKSRDGIPLTLLYYMDYLKEKEENE